MENLYKFSCITNNMSNSFLCKQYKGGNLEEMKKIFAVLLIAAFAISLGACAKDQEPGAGTSSVTATPSTTPATASPTPGMTTTSPGAATSTASPGGATATASATATK